MNDGALWILLLLIAAIILWFLVFLPKLKQARAERERRAAEEAERRAADRQLQCLCLGDPDRLCRRSGVGTHRPPAHRQTGHDRSLEDEGMTCSAVSSHS